MKKALFILFATTAFAILPPLAQSIRETESLLSDPRFYSSLGSAEMIKEIVRVENGFLVITQNYAMRVDVKYKGREGQRVGPIAFELEFHQPDRLAG